MEKRELLQGVVEEEGGVLGPAGGEIRGLHGGKK
jgi:hypothetical protein